MSRHHLALICLLAIVVAACDRPSPGTSVSRSDQETPVAGQLRGPAAVAPFSTPYANIHQWEWQ